MVLYRCGPESCIVEDVRCANDVSKTSIDGVKFLSLPSLRYYRGDSTPIRAVLGSNRLMLLNLTYYYSKALGCC